MNENKFKIPAESNTMPEGQFNVADVAGPPSPVKLPLVLLPATVVIIPVETVTFRMRLLPWSAINTLSIRNSHSEINDAELIK